MSDAMKPWAWAIQNNAGLIDVYSEEESATATAKWMQKDYPHRAPFAIVPLYPAALVGRLAGALEGLHRRTPARRRLRRQMA